MLALERGRAQPSLLGYAKVTKSSTVGRGKKSVKITIENVETLLSPTVEECSEPVLEGTKRKRGIYASEAEESETEEVPVKKVLRFIHLSPFFSLTQLRSKSFYQHHLPIALVAAHLKIQPYHVFARVVTIALPAHLPCHRVSRTSLEMHEALVKAFSFHRAHNGPTAPAELNELMSSITRLHKQRSVGKEDVQRMLAIYEVEDKSAIPAKASLVCTQSPFKLITSGVGSNRRNFVEYIGTSTLKETFRAGRRRDCRTATNSGSTLHISMVKETS